MDRLVVALASLVLVAGFPAAARADASLHVYGSLTVSWHGDPARGCAAAGVCGVSGTSVMQGGGAAFLQRQRSTRYLDLLEASSTVRVLRQAADGQHTCVDPIGRSPELVRLEANGVVDLSQAAPYAGDCAGPIPNDLDRLTLRYRSPRRHPLRIDLSGRRSFSAGPYRGELISTLRLTPGATGGSSESSSHGGGSSSGPPAMKLVETIDLTYRTTASGSLNSDFSGFSDPSCEPFDACGASGSVDTSLPGAPRVVDLVGSAVTRAQRTSAQILADAREGRLSVLGGEAVPARTAGQVAWASGATCRDTVAGGQLSLVLGPPSQLTGGSITFYGAASDRSELLAQLSADSGAEALRTRCPGPSAGEVGGQDGEPLSSGQIPLPELGSRSISLSLPDSGSFSFPGYSGTRSGGINLQLSLVRIKAATERVRVR